MQKQKTIDQQPQSKDRGSSEERRPHGPAVSHPQPEGWVWENNIGMSLYSVWFETLKNVKMAPSNFVDNGAKQLLSATG